MTARDLEALRRKGIRVKARLRRVGYHVELWRGRERVAEGAAVTLSEGVWAALERL